MARNSAPSSKYRTAREPITPIKESALAIGCFWRTRLNPQTTATMAQMMNIQLSIKGSPHVSRKQRDKERGEQQIRERAWKEKCPSKMHQLVIAEPRKCPANPDISEQQGT